MTGVQTCALPIWCGGLSAGWLPPNTETLVVASEAFTTPELGEEVINVQQLPSSLAILQHLALELVLVYGPRYLNNIIRLVGKDQLPVECEIGEK